MEGFMQQQSTYNRNMAAVKFLACSIIGIFLFFIKVPLGGEMKIPIDYIVGVIRGHLENYLPWLVLAISAYGVIDTFFLRKTYRLNKTNKIMAAIRTMGLFVVAMAAFRIGPAAIIADDMAPYCLNILGGSVGLTVMVGTLILPLLIDYGLANAIGVLVRPIMRPLFKVPGRTAVVAMTSYFGNYSLGHIGIENMYKKGQITGKESVIVGTGFATASIVNFMVFANMLGIMEYWNQYFLLVTVVTFAITAITIRLYPIRGKKDDYYPGVTPEPEPEYSKNILKNAWEEGIRTAGNAPAMLKNTADQIKNGINILGSLLPVSMCFMVAALLLQRYTPVFTWIGYLFYPLFKLVGMPDLKVVLDATGTSLVDIMMVTSVGAQAIHSGVNLAMTTRFFLAALPVTMIVFFAGFVPCILSTQIPIKIHELAALWFIRVALTILFVGVFGLIFL